MLDKGNFRLQKFSHFALIEKVKCLHFLGTILPPLKLALMLSCDRFNESALFVQVLRGCILKILKPILDYITDFLETLRVTYTLVG